MAAVGVELQRLNQGSSHEDFRQDVGHTGGQEIEPHTMAAEQGDSQSGMGPTERQETEPQVMEMDDQQHETQVNEVSPFSLACI